jgi:3'-phosphoadenosine 5'-phosphosulfate sulfotransferase (PAPS reductase)/FAD synthetase
MREQRHTADDLKTMQAWPLSRKIMVTQTRIVEWYMRFDGKVSVSISGGKDSAVLLDLARRCYPVIEAVYVNTGLDFPEVRRFAIETPNVTVLQPKMRFDEVVKEYGWCYPSKDVSHTIYYARKGSGWALDRLKGVNADGTPSRWRETHYKKWAFLLDAPFKISANCCGIMKESPLDKYRKETGKQPIVGTMAVESERRRQAWLQTGCNNFDSKNPVSKPLSFWTNDDVLRYIRDYNIPIASVYGDIVEDKKGRLATTGEQRTGCVFCPVGCHRDKVNRF